MALFAAYIPIGPDEIEVTRAADLIDSLCAYEPLVRWVVVVDDSRDNRCLERLFRVPSTCELIVLPHSRRSADNDILGGLCTANLIALNYVKHYLDAEFYIKLDTDALVIAPFSESILRKFHAVPDAGILGLLGDSCNHESRSFRYDELMMNLVNKALAVSRKLPSTSPEVTAELNELDINTVDQMRNLVTICKQISVITETGFHGEHCQGGAYAVSRNMVNRMHMRGFLENQLLWAGIQFGEDRMMGVYCAAVGLRSVDFSGHNEPFGVQALGLAYPPEQLLQRGYSIIHSVKSDPRYAESDIRQFFYLKRQGLIS
jgi:hypothetical protein